MTRYHYHTGFRTRDAAEEALDDALAAGEISEGEWPKIEPYADFRQFDGGRITLYAITLQG